MQFRFLFALFFLSLFINVNAQDYRFGKVSEVELLQKEHPIDPTANAAILYREVKSEFQYSQDSGWYLVMDYFERVKIYNKEGFDWANITIDLYKDRRKDILKGLRAHTYHLNAKGKVDHVRLGKDGIFEQETTKYLSQTKLTMPNIQEGSVIEYKYSIESPFIFNIDEFRFQETIPVDKVNITFNTPEYFIYNTHQRGGVPYTVTTSSRDRNLRFNQTTRDMKAFSGSGIPETTVREVSFKEDSYNVDLEKVPAMKVEAYAGNINSYITALQFELSYVHFPGSVMETYATTWEDVSRSIYRSDSFGSELDRTNYFEKDIDALLEGIRDPAEKTARIFYYVVGKMNWNGYYGYYTNEGTRNAYKKGSGNVADINLMLTAMLRYANLNANPVLASTKSHGIPLFPTRNGFNYVVTALELPQGTILLDATNKNAEIGVLKPEIINGEGRFIKKDGFSTWMSLRSLVPAVKSSMVSMEIKPDFSITGTAQNRFTGNYAFLYRSQYKSLDNPDQIKSLEKNLKQTELSEVSFENLDKLGQPVALKYNFSSFEGIEDVAGKLYFSPLAFMATSENPFKAETREYPIDFGFPMKDRYIVNIQLPEGYQVESVPENAMYNLEGNKGSYRYMISQVGDKLQLSVELAINSSFMAANEYGNLKRLFELMVKKEAEKVVLSKA